MLPRQKGSILLRGQKENVRDPNTEHAEAEYQREQARTTVDSALQNWSLWAESPSTNLTCLGFWCSLRYPPLRLLRGVPDRPRRSIYVCVLLQAKWQGKAQRHAAVDERLRRSLYPEPGDAHRN